MKKLLCLSVLLFGLHAHALSLLQLRYDPLPIVTSGSMTGTSTINSTIADAEQNINFSVQCIWTGTPNGTLTLQGSNDIAATSASVTNWSTIATQSISGSAGNVLWNEANISSRWVRTTYTNSSSTGTLNCTYGRKL